MSNNYCVYFKTCDEMFRVCLHDMTLKTTEHLPTDMSAFYMSGKAYEANDEDLMRYCNDVYEATQELAKHKAITFNYITPFIMRDGNPYYRTHSSNIEALFKMLCKGKYEHFASITMAEEAWFSKCHNGGLTYCHKGTHDVYGYDFSAYYGSILGDSDFRFPMKAGTDTYYDALPQTIVPGFYNVRITCDDPNIHKVFSFSKHHVYHSVSLKFAIELKEKHNFNMKIELNIDAKYNAHTYAYEDLAKSKSVFGKWHKTIVDLKCQFPKNILIKMLSSSLWGHLSKRNIVCVMEDKIKTLEGTVGMKITNDYIIQDYITKANDTSYYKLLKGSKPYVFNMRLKPFITAFGRVQTARIALQHIDSVVRIHTDGICFNKALPTPIKNFNPEDKTTGRIEFKSLNTYIKMGITYYDDKEKYES